MPQIEIRPAVATDIPTLIALEHDYTSDYVWQMEVQAPEEGQLRVSFRETRLPRSVRVDYPRSPRALLVDWQERDALLVALLEGEVAGYAALRLNVAPLTAWMTDLVVRRRWRRQGIGSALTLAGQEWGLEHNCRYLVLEMQPKNFPAIGLARKLAFDFCGYNDRYYENHDIGLFFARPLR